MPITENEKIQAHPRPSSDYFKAIPIKKRRIFYPRSPSPPPRSQSPTPSDATGIPEGKPESSVLASTTSVTTETNPAQVNVGTSESASRESPKPPSDATGIPEGKPESSVLASTTSVTTETNPAQVNVGTSESASRESPKPPSPKQVDSGTAEMKPEFSSPSPSVVRSSSTEANYSVPGNDTICDHHELTGPTIEIKPEPLRLESPFPKTGDNSAQVDTLTGENAPPQPFEFPIPASCGISEKTIESSNPNSSIPKMEGKIAQVNAVSPRESYEGPVNRDLNLCPDHEILPSFLNLGFGLNVAANDLGRTSNDQEMVLNNTSRTQQVTGSTITFSGMKEIFGASTSDSGGKGKSVSNEGIAVKQESLELQNPQSRSISSDSQHLFLNRSNWDLNTPMNTWEGSSIGTSMNSQTGDCVQNKGLELGLKQILHTRHSGTDSIQGNHELHKNGHHLKLPSPPTSTIGLKSEACLDLQLSSLSNPSTMPAKPVALKEMPFLSLATNPALSSQLSIGRTVKSEPIESGQKETGKTQMGILTSLNLNHVKSEPCQGQEVSKTTVTAVDVNSAGTKAIKPEPLEDQSLRVGRQFPLELCNSSSLAPQTSVLHQSSDEDNSKAANVASEPPGPGSSLFRSENEKLDINIPNNSSNMVDKAPNLVNQNPIPDSAVSISATVDEAATETAIELSTVVPNPVISDVNDTNLPQVVEHETSGLPLTSFPEPLISNGENYNPQEEGERELVVQGNLSDSEVVDMDLSDDEILRNLSRKVSEPGEVVGKVEELGKVEGNVVSGSISRTRKQCGSDEDYEDGEVRDRALNVTTESSCKESEGQLLKDVANSTTTVDVPVSKPLQTEVKADTKVDSLKELKAVVSMGSVKELEAVVSKGSDDAGLGDSRVEPSSSSASVRSAESADKSRLSKTIRRIPKDFQKNNDKDTKSSNLNSKTILPVQQQNANGSNLARGQVPSKIEPPAKEEATTTKDANDRGKSTRIIYLNPASNGLAPGKEKLMPSRVESDRPVDRSFRRDRSRSRGSRDDSGNERPWKVDNERYNGRPVEKYGSGEIHNRRADLINSMHGDRNATYDSLEQRNLSGGARYLRPTHSNSEVATNGGSPDGSTRFTRRPPNEDTGKISRFQYRRRSPGGRVQIPMGVRHPVRENVPDFELLAHEAKMMRNLSEDMVEHSMLPHHPRSQFKRDDEILMRRERRSFSPPMRRGGGPLQLPPNQQRSSHQWSPPRRHDDYGEPQEFVRCRSPPVMRVNRMQPPPQERPCFPEDIMVRRRGGSPPYINRVASNMMEHDFPRQMRGPNRIPRRFNMIDPRDIAEEEYIGEIQEFAVEEDEFVEDRRSEERPVPIHPFRQQRFVANDRDSEGFRFRVEDGPPPPRALRFRPNTNEGFPEGSGPRDFDLRFRNRLGNSSGRMRGIVEEQEGNYRHHEELEWCGPPAFSDGRPKRRRY